MNTKQEVIERIEPATMPTVITPMAMLNNAVISGASMETLERLMGLSERWEANQARKSFDAAISLAKGEIGPIVKNATGHNNKRYADFSAIARAVDPVLAKHGLTYRFRTNQNDRIHVTCIVSHRDGHAEETTLAAPADTSGAKNAIQAIGSTLSYLQRYSLVQALGLAVTNDDDGRAAGIGETVSAEQVDKLREALKFIGGHEARFLKFIKVEKIEDIPASRFDECMNVIKGSRK